MGNIITFCKQFNNLMNEHELLKLFLTNETNDNKVFKKCKKKELFDIKAKLI